MIETLFGRPLSFWADVLGVLERHNIKDAEDLEQRIALRQYNSVEVVDSINTERVLGMLDNVSSLKGGNRYTVPLWRRSAISFDPSGPIDMARVDFSIGYKDVTPDGILRRAVLQTSAPLETIMALDSFRLPHETRREAQERLYRSRY